MNITRNNYEPFVIDYLDGTLSPEMTADLLLFLELNPDIAADVDGLLNDPIPLDISSTFSLKDSLKKDEPSFSQSRADELMFLANEGLAGTTEIAELNVLLSDYPALQVHMDAMKRARWTPEPMVFANKESIKVPDAVDLSQDDYRLAALLEGDLSNSEKNSFEKEIASSQSLSLSWSAMQKTRLAAKEIVFEKKDSLYQKQAKVIALGRALYFSAAACAILFVAIFWKDSSTPAEIAGDYKHEIPVNQNSNQGDKPEKEIIETPSNLPTVSPTDLAKDDYNKNRVNNKIPSYPDPIAYPSIKEDYAQETSTKIGRIKLKNQDKLHTTKSAGEILSVDPSVASLPLPQNPAQVKTMPKETFPTILQFAEEKAKQKLLGYEPAEDGIAMALVEKGLRKISGNKDAIAEQKGKSFRFKLGKFEVARN